MKKKTKPVYELAKENKEDPKQSQILVKNLTDTITFQEVLDNITKLEQARTEITAKNKIDRAKMVNITRNHPDVDKLLPKFEDTDKERDAKEVYLIALQMFLNSREVLRNGEASLKQIAKVLREEKENLKLMKEATGIDYER